MPSHACAGALCPLCGAVSSLQRSAVLINPQLPEATELQQWWEATGHSEATTHVGEGLESAMK